MKAESSILLFQLYYLLQELYPGHSRQVYKTSTCIFIRLYNYKRLVYSIYTCNVSKILHYQYIIIVQELVLDRY